MRSRSELLSVCSLTSKSGPISLLSFLAFPFETMNDFSEQVFADRRTDRVASMPIMSLRTIVKGQWPVASVSTMNGLRPCLLEISHLQACFLGVDPLIARHGEHIQ